MDRKEAQEKYNDSRVGMIVSTMINIVVGKKGKPVTPLGVMGYDENAANDLDPDRVPTVQEKQIAQQATALRFRLMQAGQKRGGLK